MRIAAKVIQDPILKIREAKLAVNLGVGDATRVERTDFELFKDKCLSLWRLPEEKDRYLALQQFLSVKRRVTIGTYIAKIEKSRSNIISDLQADNAFMKGTAQEWVATGRKEILVSLEEILNYVH